MIGEEKIIKSSLIDDEDKEKSKIFKDELLKFNTLHGKESFKVPQIGGKELDLYKLFKEVLNRGGSNKVSETKQWKEIVNSLDLPASCTSASFTLRNHYTKCLNAYENYYLKNQNNSGTNSMNLINQNFPNKDHPPVNQNSSQNNIHSTQPNPQMEQKFLNKKVVRPDAELNLIFRFGPRPIQPNRDKVIQKKVRVLNAVPDLRRVVLAFESHITSEIIWSLNMLTLFSANVNCNLHVDSQPYLLESMTEYLKYCVNNISETCFIIDLMESKNENYEKINKNSIFNKVNAIKKQKPLGETSAFNFQEEINSTINLPTISKKKKNLEEIQKVKEDKEINQNFNEITEYELMEHLITIIGIVRNLTFIRSNEPSIVKCNKLMRIIYLLFIHSNVQDIRLSCLDILTNLSKNILLKTVDYPDQVLMTIFECMKNSNREISEEALECLRRLSYASGNEEYLEKMPDEFFEELINLLINYKVEIRESALEILFCIADQKLPTKTRLGKQHKCLSRLVALICSSSVENRIPKLAACTLAKLAEVPSNLKMIMQFEQELLVASCTDDSITKIILAIISN